jgi:Ca-activated chloride channel family protein
MSFANLYAFFLIAFLPLVVIIALIAVRRKRAVWREFVADRLRSRLINRASSLPRWLGFSALLLALLFMIISVAGPQIDESKKIENTKGRNLIIVLDLSRSMKTGDLSPSRLDQAKALIYELLETLPNDRIGVVGFSSSPFLFAPLTIDHSAVRETVEQLDYDSIPTGGSDLASAIKLAVATLKETAQTNNGLLVLSDGEEHSPKILSTLQDIKESGTYVFAVGVGTEDGGFIPDENEPDGKFRDVKGDVVISRLQTATLENFATQAGGRFTIAQSSADIPAMIKTAVADLESFELKGREKISAQELFQWTLFPAILFLIAAILFSTRWRAVSRVATAAAGFTFAMMMATPSHAAVDASISDARAAMARNDFTQARDLFSMLATEEIPSSPEHSALMLGKATAEYRLGELPEARKSFSQALTTEDSAIRTAAHQGLGNLLFQLGWQELSGGENYPGAEFGPAQFEEHFKERVAEWMKDDKTDAKTPSEGYQTMRRLMLNWADSVRHTQSILSMDPQQQDAQQLKVTSKTYLEMLRKALEEQKKEMQAQMGGQGEGDGEGEGEGDTPGEGEGQGEDGPPGEGKSGNQNKGEGEGDEDKGPNGKTPEDEKTDPKNEHGKDEKPGETKEQSALRKLNENADLQRGIVAPGRFEFRRPEKDW